MGRTPGSRLAVVGHLQKVVKPWEDWDEIDGFMIIASAFPRRRRGKQFMRPSGFRQKKKKKRRAKPKQLINHQKIKPPSCPPSPPSPPVPRVKLRFQPTPPPPPSPPKDKPVASASWRKKPVRKKIGPLALRTQATKEIATKMLESIRRERTTPVEHAWVKKVQRERARSLSPKKPRYHLPRPMQLPWALPPPPRFHPTPACREPEPNMLAMGEVDLLCWETMPPPTP